MNRKTIRPISELRDTNAISELCHQLDRPIFITKNGYADLVILADETYRREKGELLSQEAEEQFQATDSYVNDENNFGFVRVRTVALPVKVAAVSFNTTKIKEELRLAEKDQVDIVLFPELCLTSQTAGPLLLQKTILSSVEKSLQELAAYSQTMKLFYVIGAPWEVAGEIYNCAFVFQGDQLLGIVPGESLQSKKSRNYHTDAFKTTVICAGQKVSFGDSLIFLDPKRPALKIGIEIGEAVSLPLSPAARHALNGATLILNPYTVPTIAGQEEKQINLVEATSKQLLCAYVRASGGPESTTDFVFKSGSVIAEAGDLTVATEFSATVDLDLERLKDLRQRSRRFIYRPTTQYEFIPFASANERRPLQKALTLTPYMPGEKDELDYWCEQILNLQARALASRLESCGIKNVVIGLSGGLDSAWALVVAVEALRLCHCPLKNIYTFSLPCFGTGHTTRLNARKLAESLEVSFAEIDITTSVRSHLEDLEHDGRTADITFENAQARERTQFLFDKANSLNALVVGTGDLSELALGYCTYNGDHMSNYAVNCSLPKTAIRALAAFYAKTHKNSAEVMTAILETPVSPELIPAATGGIQRTEEIVGPYELHDFFLYHLSVDGFSVEKTGWLSVQSFADKYEPLTIIKWLKVFVQRFFSQQFKRSCQPDGPQVTLMSLSPRTGFQIPSDTDPTDYLAEVALLEIEFSQAK